MDVESEMQFMELLPGKLFVNIHNLKGTIDKGCLKNGHRALNKAEKTTARTKEIFIFFFYNLGQVKIGCSKQTLQKINFLKFMQIIHLSLTEAN